LLRSQKKRRGGSFFGPKNEPHSPLFESEVSKKISPTGLSYVVCQSRTKLYTENMDKIRSLIPDGYEPFVVFIFIVVLTIFANWTSRRAFNRFIKHRMDNEDLTNYKFIGNALSAIIYTIGFIFAIREFPPLKAFAGSLLTGAGILAAILGLASQQAFSNIVSGIFIVISKPFRVNDRLKIKEIYKGIVEDITLRHTVIRDFENRRIIVPNSVIASEILVNADFNDDPVCKLVEFSISYKDSIDKVKKLMAEEVAKHPLYLDRRTETEKDASKPLVMVRVVRMTDWSIVIRADAWAKNPSEGFDLYCDLLESIKKRFDTEGVEMPYPHYKIIQSK
jgi:small conductance mechanosensitive channel